MCWTTMLSWKCWKGFSQLSLPASYTCMARLSYLSSGLATTYFWCLGRRSTRPPQKHPSRRCWTSYSREWKRAVKQSSRLPWLWQISLDSHLRSPIPSQHLSTTFYTMWDSEPSAASFTWGPPSLVRAAVKSFSLLRLLGVWYSEQAVLDYLIHKPGVFLMSDHLRGASML